MDWPEFNSVFRKRQLANEIEDRELRERVARHIKELESASHYEAISYTSYDIDFLKGIGVEL